MSFTKKTAGDGSINPASVELSPGEVRRFRRTVYRYFREHGRRLPWRETSDPYHILVSEIMLQQTQIPRVLSRYLPFIRQFPDFESLAGAPWPEVMAAWQGLGYNRRALALQRLARQVVAEFGGSLPDSVMTLKTLPGIGPATAGAIAAFAFNQPVVFIETNIRRVFLHAFFSGRDRVGDREILPLIEQTLDRPRVRLWYYALMDYGAMLPRLVANPNRRSLHYQRQTPFAGSDRQLRGLILKALLDHTTLLPENLAAMLTAEPRRLEGIVRQLVREGFLVWNGKAIALAPVADRRDG